MKIKIKNLILLICAILVITLCSVFYSNIEIGNDKRYNVIFIPKVKDYENEFWTSVISGAEISAKERNISLEVIAPKTEDDIETQSKYILEAIEKKPDAIILSPISFYEMNGVIEQVKKNNIKLIFVDSKVNTSVEDCFIGTNNFEEGKVLGEFISNDISNDSKIGIISHVSGSYTANLRYKGIEKGLGGKKECIVESIEDANVYKESFRLTEDLLERRSDIDVLVALNLYSLIGASRAVKNMGLSKDVKVYGFDINREGIEYLEDETINGVIVQRAFNMGYLGVENAYKCIKGIKIDKNIDSGAKLIWRDNMYESDSEKILFQF